LSVLIRRCILGGADICAIYDSAFRIDGPCALLDELDECRIDGHTAEEGHVEVLSHDGAATLAENICALAAVWADEASHVLDNAEDADARLATKVELLLYVGNGDGLRCSNDDGTCKLARGGGLLEERLEQRNVLVGGARGRVDEEVVELGPQDVGQELADHGRLLGPAPDDGIAAVGEDEAKGHAGEGADGDGIAGGVGGVGGVGDGVAGGQRVRLVDRDGNPAAGGLADLLVLDAKEAGDRRPCQVDIEDTDAVALQRQAESELRRDARLADPAFARQHEHNLVDVVERHLVRVGVLVGVLVQSAAARIGRFLGAAECGGVTGARAEGIVVVQCIVGGANVSALKSSHGGTPRHVTALHLHLHLHCTR
jgi:hypothetical protein